MPFTDSPNTNSSSCSSLKSVGSHSSTYGNSTTAGQIVMNDDCLKAFEEMKMNKVVRTIIFCLETTSSTAPGDSVDACCRIKVYKVLGKNSSHEDLLEELRSYQSLGQCRYVLTDFDYLNPTTNGEASKMIFFLWMPPKANIRDKMSYISNKNVLLKGLSGVYIELQHGTVEDYGYEKILKSVLSKQYTSNTYNPQLPY